MCCSFREPNPPAALSFKKELYYTPLSDQLLFQGKNFKWILTIIRLTWAIQTPLKIKGNLMDSKANAQQALVQWPKEIAKTKLN